MRRKGWLFYLWCTGLLLLVAYLSYRGGEIQQEMEPNVIPSSYRWSPSGTAAFHALLLQLGYPVRRWHRSFRYLNDVQGLLIVLEPGAAPVFSPDVEFSGAEMQALLDWIRAGNRCLFSAETVMPPDLEPASIQVPVPEEMRVDRPDPPLSGVFTGATLVRLPASSPSPLFDGLTQLYTAYPPLPEAGSVPDTPQVVMTRLQWRGKEAEGSPEWTDQHGALLVEQRWGEGRMYLLASASPLMNDLLGRGDNARWGTRLVQSLWDRKGEIFFDEYHHGYQEQRTVLWWLLRPERRPALGQAAAVLLLALFALAMNFGRPVPYAPLVTRRSSGEHIQALAALYLRARARPEIARMLLHSMRERLARTLSLSPSSPWERLAAAAETRCQGCGAPILRLTQAIEGSLAHEGPTDQSMLGWSREMERWLRKVEGRGEGGGAPG